MDDQNVEDQHPAEADAAPPQEATNVGKANKGTFAAAAAAAVAAQKVKDMTPETLIIHGADRQNISKQSFEELASRLVQKFYNIPKATRTPAWGRILDTFWSKGRGFVQCTTKETMAWTKGQVAQYNGPDKKPLKAWDQNEYDQHIQCTVVLRSIFKRCPPKLVIGEAIEDCLGVIEAPTITAIYNIPAGRVIKITLKAETARMIKDHQRINGVMTAPFAPKLRFRFDDEDPEPEEALATALNRQMTNVTSTDDANEIEQDNGDEEMELLRQASGDLSSNTNLDVEGLLSDPDA